MVTCSNFGCHSDYVAASGICLMDASGHLGSTLKFVPTAQCATSLWCFWCSNGKYAHALIQQRVRTWQVKCCMTTVDLQQAANMKSIHTHLQGKHVDQGMHSCGRRLVHLSKTRCTSCKSPKSVKASLSSASVVVKGRLRKNSLPVGSSSSATHKPLLSNTGTIPVTARYQPCYCCHCRAPNQMLLPPLSTSPVTAPSTSPVTAAKYQP